MPRSMSFLACLVAVLLVLTGCKTSEPAAETAHDALGVWAVIDHDGDLFDIVVYPNGKVVSNWSKGPEGAKGQIGGWKATGDGGIEIHYADGWRDLFKPDGNGFIQEGYAPENEKNGLPVSSCRAVRVTEPRARFVGVWETPDRDSGKPLYIAVFSDGSAKKTVPGDNKGMWVVHYGNAWFTWADGWSNRFVRTQTRYVDHVWRPTEPVEGTQPAILEVKRVGDPSVE